ncbi:hypothetical protein GYMLUDRAFT_47427 [Collybiopsis luxurians FD-317 M1]|uniref:Uncharacterized protein n=1 Tax=Collybiopsis luxurians FD-317 M1 TaxID=944289 RepID=A0A0D0BM79_9AGAR|nr:hypothetical protein GYMLUDRAFT_47427 [Collybiopsis luxurians FD-317 M1]
MTTVFVTLILAWLYILSSWTSTVATISPKDCLNNDTLVDLIDCLNNFTVGPDFYDTSSYAAAQPTSEQLNAWTSVVTSMLDSDTTDCSSILLPDSLSSLYAVTSFLDVTTNKRFCVLAEATSFTFGNQSYYTKGWGVMVVPALKRDISRTIHLSAPHPLFDIGTPQQAAAMFVLSGAHSVLISGRIRMAYEVSTDCIIPASPATIYCKTDPAHDVNEPFNAANRAIRTWQDINGRCPRKTCAYLQIHGKGASSCPTDTIFISSGLGTSNSSIHWYETQPDLPSRRLKDFASQVFPTFNASLPSDDTSCDLTATDNVFGRLINGIPEADVCTVTANTTTATGEFVHIEQAIIARQSTAYEGWGAVLKKTFPTCCRDGMEEDEQMGLCI